MKKMLTAIFPGTFDPITNGHIALISRASSLFAHLIVAVAVNTSKQTFFTSEQRVNMATVSLAHYDNVDVIGFEQLTAEFARLHKATVLIRGIRTAYDFEYEHQLAEMNYYLNPDLETVFLLASSKNRFISSSIVRELAQHHGDVAALVPSHVNQALLVKVNEK